MTEAETPEDLWVFGYGSLIWRPGFDFVERAGARLHGFHRSLCIYSHVHRGTPETPGLVLGLDRGGICRGVAFRVPVDQAEETIDYLRAREQATAVYLERRLAIRLDDGRRLNALTYIADRAHGQYAGRLPEAAVLGFVRQGKGVSGENPDYVRRTQEHLHEMGIHDPLLTHLVAELDKSASPAST